MRPSFLGTHACACNGSRRPYSVPVSTVARYLLREFLAASALVLLALSVTWLAADSLLHLDDLGDGVGVLIASSFYRLLDVLPVSVPAACMVGVV